MTPFAFVLCYGAMETVRPSCVCMVGRRSVPEGSESPRRPYALLTHEFRCNVRHEGQRCMLEDNAGIAWGCKRQQQPFARRGYCAAASGMPEAVEDSCCCLHGDI